MHIVVYTCKHAYTQHIELTPQFRKATGYRNHKCLIVSACIMSDLRGISSIHAGVYNYPMHARIQWDGSLTSERILQATEEPCNLV